MTYTLNHLRIDSSRFSSNAAGNMGGAMHFLNDSVIHFSGEMTVEGNSAFTGGGVSMVSSVPWSMDEESSSLLLESNQASYGSAIAMADLYNDDDILRRLHNLTIRQNSATIAGTVFWLSYPGATNAEPAGLDSESIVWESNSAPYGERAATQTVRQVVSPTYKVTIYDKEFDPPINVSLLDFYNATVIGSSMFASVFAERYSCQDATGYLRSSLAHLFKFTHFFRFFALTPVDLRTQQWNAGGKLCRRARFFLEAACLLLA